MKYISFVLLFFILLWACNKSRQNKANTASQSTNADSAAIADAIHGFYTWYVAFAQDTARQIDFVEEASQHLRLNQSKMERYYANFKASGFISDEFIKNEYDFYKKCSLLWQREDIGDVPSGMDADKYFCAQDWEPEFWTKSPVRINYNTPEKVVATLYGSAFGSQIERTMQLKKEKGKWLITSIECDMGIEVTDADIKLKDLTLNEKYFTAKSASGKALSEKEFTRLEIGNIISEDIRKDPNTKIFILDTLLVNDKGNVVLVARDSENEAEAWLVQYDSKPRIVFWDQVYYGDYVEYLKTINTTVAGNTVTIQTTTDVDGSQSTKTNKYVLNRQLIFERDNQK